jgi:Holliday junction resolvase RusA-like endonuclease
MIKFTIPGTPITKKNSSQIFRTRNGTPFVTTSKQYKEYARNTVFVCEDKIPIGIDYPVNVKCIYYMPTKRKVDLCNLLSATCDILVEYEILADDNSNIVISHDGSRVTYDKQNPRCEVEICKS